MKVLGIESSCDECAAAVVEDGKTILSNVVASQIEIHAPYQGVVPELASRMHTEWILDVVQRALDQAHCEVSDIEGVAATAHPGLLGSLLVGVSFAKAFAYARNIPFVAVNHMLAHLYAPLMSEPVEYPFLGLLVSGGHSILCRVEDFDRVVVLGTTVDDAVGEAFDKVAKHYGLGYPGGIYIDQLAQKGDPEAFRFPLPNLYKGSHRYDVSYSGLKTAVINQIDQFKVKEVPRDPLTGHYRHEDVAASFQKAAIEILLRALLRAVDDTGLSTIVIGGGVAANSYLRQRLSIMEGLHCYFPPPSLCGDNGAMIAGIGYRYFSRGDQSPWTVTASARVLAFKRRYP